MPLPGLHATDTLWLDVDHAGLRQATLQLLALELDEFESLAGCRVAMGRPGPDDASWVLQSSDDDTPCLAWQPHSRRLVSRGRTVDDQLETFNLLATLVRAPDRPVRLEAPDTPQAAAQRIRDEVLHSYPYFALRGIDPDDWAAGRLQQVPEGWGDFGEWALEWVAQLDDAHTAVLLDSERGHIPSLVGSMNRDGIVLEDVGERSEAHTAGVREGWTITVADPQRWLRTTGATARQHARVAARRALAIPGSERTFVAHGPGGREVTWVERRRAPVLDDVLTMTPVDENTMAARLRAFIPGVGVEGAFDELCAAAHPDQTLLLDLRGNTGGNLVLATQLRDRFLHERTRIGSVVFTDGRGGLGPEHDRWAEPSSRPRWPGRLVVQVDSMTYSAAEDFVLGLQGLDHVRVQGSTTGGGSGRARLLPLGPDLSLRISTAITRDRDGRPVEHLGIQPD